MNDAELFDQYLDALRRDPNAAPPAGLDAESAAFIRVLAAAEKPSASTDAVRDRVWHKALSLAQNEADTFSRPSSKNGQFEQKLTLLKSSDHIHVEEDDTRNTTTALPTHPSAPRTRPPTVRYFWQYTLTIGAAIVIVALIGGLLVEMVNDPIDGYPALESGETLEPTAEVCDSRTDYMARGEADIFAGDYAVARAAYDCALEVDPTNYAAMVLRGGFAGLDGDYDQLGYDLYTALSHRVSGSDPLSLNLVKLMPTLNEAIGSRPDDATLYLLRGLAAFVADLRTNALKDFEWLMTLAPDNAIGYLFNWSLKPEANLLTDDDITKSLELAPDSTLADWLVSLNFTQAVSELWAAEYDRAVQDHPDHPFAYEARGIANIFREDMEAAAADFYQHIQLYSIDDAEEHELTLGETFALDAIAGQVYRLTFKAQQWQTLNVTPAKVYAPTNWIYPPTVVVLNPAGEVMPAPYAMESALGISRTPIRGLEIMDSGVYSILLTTNATGPLNITVSEAR
jgi:tetratricopeptide (TPR) repeat protein